ncbi:MAG: hypothetical protein ACOYXM_10470 [Actinomycetota bacterium]
MAPTTSAPQPRRLLRTLAAAAGPGVHLLLTAAHLVLAWMMVFSLEIGPVIADVDARAGHGIHAGDVLALPFACFALALCAHGLAGERSARVPLGAGLARASL